MTVQPGPLPGLFVVEPAVFGDARGFFMEAWHGDRYRAAGLDMIFVQDNVSFSRRGILRGLHYQKPNAQGKLVSVLQGEVFDVAVDLRRSSPTFGKAHWVTLSVENRLQFYIPPGFAHGFQVTTPTALFYYKCTAYYSPNDELAVRWDDPQLALPWPIHDPILSARDQKAPCLRDVPPERLFE